MLRIFKKSLRTGVVTSSYPAVPEQAPLGFRGKPLIDEKKCTACAKCAEACPSGALRLVEASLAAELIFKLDYCVFCGICAECCPNGAIVLGRDFELAAKDRTAFQEKFSIAKVNGGAK